MDLKLDLPKRIIFSSLVSLTVIKLFYSRLWDFYTVKPPVSDSELFQFNSEVYVQLWIDIPNHFPWRHCFKTKGTEHLRPTECNLSDPLFLIKPATQDTFRIIYGDNNCLSMNGNNELVESADCDNSLWTWNKINGHLKLHGSSLCVNSGEYYHPVKLQPCKDYTEEQMMEIGTVTTTIQHTDNFAGNITKDSNRKSQYLYPYDMELWRLRVDRLRDYLMERAKIEALEVIHEYRQMRDNNEFDNPQGNRRAVVFYMDKSDSFLKMLDWWIYAWRFSGLDTEEQALDIIVFTDPQAIQKLPEDCTKMDFKNHDPTAPGPGVCLYISHIPVSAIDTSYDAYSNSLECLFSGDAIHTLEKYKILIRADIDTFPTPGLVDFWPDYFVANKNGGYHLNLQSVEDALKDTADQLGIEHTGLKNLTSTWIGDSKRVIMISKLSVYIFRFLSAYLFGPGTMCRCATCIELPETCTWGGGIYAGVRTLYSSEIALNEGLTTNDIKNYTTTTLVDEGCNIFTTNICIAKLLHARHNSDLFSKYQFLEGKYKDYDMSELDIATTGGYATYIALTSSDQGVNGEVALNKFLEKIDDEEPMNFCKLTK